MQQTIAERVQIMAAHTVSPQTLKSKFWGRQERERDVRGAWGGVNPTYSGPVRTPGGGRRVRTRKMAGEEGMAEGGKGGCMLTLRAPRASSQVELGATFSSCPDSGQGRSRGTGGQHTQTFPS